MRRLGRSLTVLLILFATAGAAVIVASATNPDVAWRVKILEFKARGDLPEIPIRNLLEWLKPASPVYLANLAEMPNPNVAIRNTMISDADAKDGQDIYARTCERCHGERGRGHAGPNLVEAAGTRSDWSFLSIAKWGIPGTSMQAQPLTDVQIWKVHAFLRGEILQATRMQRTDSQHLVDVSPEEILASDEHPEQWLTYAGDYAGHRHTSLKDLTKANAKNLRVAWVAQLHQSDTVLETSPIVADGVMFVSESGGGVVALDAKTGATLWTFRRPIPSGLSLCCGAPNRGVAIVGQTIFVGTIDAYLIALDANTGKQRWIKKVADYRDGYSMTGAPLIVRQSVIVGVGGGEFGIRGFLAAYDVSDGHLRWQFNTVPDPGQPGSETWSGDSWKTGGAPTWVTGVYDPSQNLVLWGTGNPSPDYRGDERDGDNLFSNSVIALDADVGKLAWFYQFTPRDEHDWDANQQPVLADIDWRGTRRAVVLWANRNAFFYALDRRSGEFLFAKPFVKQTWNDGFDDAGRPHMATSARPSKAGSLVWPAVMSATNWWPPSYDAARQLVFVPTSDAAGVYYKSESPSRTPNEPFEGGYATKYATNQPATAFVKAVDATNGDVRWATVLESGSDDFMWTVGGILSTDGGVVFAGYRDIFRAFDADTGAELWRINLGGRVRGSPISYAIDGSQYIAVAAGHTVFAFTLPQP